MRKKWAFSNKSLTEKEETMDNPFVVKEGRFGALKDSFYYTDWTEHSFIADNTKRSEAVGLTFDLRRLFWARLVLIVFVGIIISRAIFLQIIKGDYYYGLSEGNRLRSEIIEAKRGIIYDRNLVPLVHNSANFVLYVIPHDLPKDEVTRDALLRQVVDILPSPTSTSVQTNLATDPNLVQDNPLFFQFKEQLAAIKPSSYKTYEPFVLADNIDYDRAMRLYLECDGEPGIFLSNKIRRSYEISEADNSASLSHVLGYTGKISEKELAEKAKLYTPIDYIGKSGIEYVWEKELKGIPGRKDSEVDALGRVNKVVSETLAVDGANLELSIDKGLQQQSEMVLRRYLEKLGLTSGSVVALDPRNGEVLAMVSLPAYDNNLFARGITSDEYQKFISDPAMPLFNRSISGEYPSGSTVKIVVSTAALQEKVISESTTVVSTGGLHVGQWFFPDWKPGGHGVVDVRKAIANSVNTFFYYVGGGYQGFVGLGVDRLEKYFKLFGLNTKSGIDLTGERTGFVPSAAWKKEVKGESWYIGDTYHLAIGQGDLTVTPLQVANYTAAVANGGTLYQPRVVKAILDSNNQLVENVLPKIIRGNLADPNNLRIVREGMRETVTAGSARSLQTVPVPVAGKTGTAQWSSKKYPHAWFAGFAPYDDPQIAIVVLVEEGREGSSVATPIAKEILTWYFGGRGVVAPDKIEVVPPIATSTVID
ncbi:MAG: penicillin-binding protein 2 [Candidatus Falkowbacteria bacterium]|nr:penicillin-binding protein 2 [Candidatus Falkowbacteria bacterium]